MYYSFILSFAEGILTFVSPCILPMLPIYFFYLAGISGEENTATDLRKSRLIMNSIAFVAGFTIVFVLLGATATVLGGFLKEHINAVRKISGIIMILFGLNFMGILKIGFLNMEKRIGYEFKELRFFNSMLFGGVFGFSWTPCVGTFLGPALLMAGNSDTVTQGIILLFLYSAGLGVPFLLSAVLFEKVNDYIKKVQRYNRIINIFSGIVLILAGIFVFTDSLKYLNGIL